MAAGDKLLLESGAGDYLLLESGAGDDLLLEAAGVGGFTTNLESLTVAEQAQATGLISALETLAKLGFAPALGLVSALDSLTKTGHQATFPGLGGFATNLESLTAAGQAQSTGHGTQLASLSALGHQVSLGAVGALTTNLASLSAAGQGAALGLITALDAMTVLEREQALGLITTLGSKTVTGYNQTFAGAGFTTNLGTLSKAALAAGMTLWELGDALAQAYCDLPVFFDTFGFAEPVTVGAITVRGIFDDHSAPGGTLEGPLVILPTGEIDGLGINQGTVVTIRGRQFTVAGVQRDGVGTSTCVLQERV